MQGKPTERQNKYDYISDDYKKAPLALDLLNMSQDELRTERDALLLDIAKLNDEEQMQYWLGRDRSEYWDIRAEIGYATYALYKVRARLSLISDDPAEKMRLYS